MTVKFKNVCVLMKNDNVKYETLNAEYYLNSLDTIEDKYEKLSYDSNVDVIPKTKAQFRRFFARYLDIIIYSNILNMVLSGILGIYMTDEDGSKILYEDALIRTWRVLWKGMGLKIPIYELVRLWKSYFILEDNEDLEWEENSVVNIKDKKLWRPFAYVGILIIIFGLLTMSIQISRMPRNRGNITIWSHIEN